MAAAGSTWCSPLGIAASIARAIAATARMSAIVRIQIRVAAAHAPRGAERTMSETHTLRVCLGWGAHST